MATLQFSCRNCWLSTVSRFGLVALFLATGAWHVLDPSEMNHYGFETWTSYAIAAVEIASAIAFLFGFGALRFIFLAIALGGAYVHIRAEELYLLILPGTVFLLVGTYSWVSRPQAACSCALRH